jgi:uncharacterized delta-60 repeat protein/uncharacterized repeat protein (TIGR01451 family)
VSGGLQRGSAFLMLIGSLLFCAGAALAQPANDNFANAQVIQGATGTVEGNNDSATLEDGEPTINGGGGASIWFVWTAPTTGAFSFDTFGSAVGDTTLGIYTGASVDALNIVAQNDDVGFANLQSQLTFVATAGAKYYIQVDSWQGLDETGDLTLNWSHTDTGSGVFSFTSQLYLYSDREVVNPIDSRMADVSPASQRASMNITRRLGYAGRVLIDYTLTNTFYTNYFITNIFGTNAFMTNWLDQARTVLLGFTNIVNTNVTWTNFYQDCQYGQFGYFGIRDGYSQTISNYTGAGSTIITTSNRVNTGVLSNYFCGNFTVVTNGAITNGTIVNYLDITTNIFCIKVVVTNVVPTALDGFDYNSISDTVTNDDYQTRLDIPVQFSQSSSFGLFDSGYPPVNRVLVASIDNVQLDPLESTDLPAPILDGSFGPTNTLINILNNSAQGGTNSATGTGRIPDDGGIVRIEVPGFSNALFLAIAPGAGVVGTNVFNVERAVNRCSEGVKTGVARVWVLRSGRNNGVTSASINYRIDFDPVNGTSANDTFRQTVFDWTNPEIPLQPASDYATPNDVAYGSPSPTDYTNVTGTLTFGPGVVRMPIDIPINNDTVTEFNEDFLIQLYDPSTDLNQRSLGFVRDAIVTILFDSSTTSNSDGTITYEQPAGACDATYNPENSDGTTPPYNLHPGANQTVNAIAVQSSDGKAIIGGDFSAYNTVPRIRLARANTDGSIDSTFNPGTGADKSVTSLFVDGSGKIVVGGEFNSIGGVSRRGVARLNVDGSLDSTFNPGLGMSAGGSVFALGSQTDGSILVGGQFSTFAGTNRVNIARLSASGGVDPSFDPGAGPNASILALALQSDGKVIIGGNFTNYAGIARAHIARLNTNGTLDTTFDPGSGANGIVYSVAVQQDGKILLAGDFTTVRDTSRIGICRLNSNGSLDATFDPNSGADDSVYSMTLQPDGKIIVGGLFKHYNQTRRVGIARLYTDGTLDTTFMDTAYNQFAGVPTEYWDPFYEGGANFVLATALQADGNVLIGGFFDRVGGGGKRDSVSARDNFARLVGGSTPGPGNIQLTQNSYTADENGGKYFVTMMRTNGHLGEASVDISPKDYDPGAGNAVNGVDYNFNATQYGTPTWIATYPPPPWTWEIQDGTLGQNQGYSDTSIPGDIYKYPENDVFIDIIDNTNVDGNRQLALELDSPSGIIQSSSYPPWVGDPQFSFPPGLGGENIPSGVALGQSQAQMTIVDNDALPGVLTFALDNFTVNESTKFAVITIIRTNGSSGTVSITYSTTNGTAIAGADYLSTSNTLTFGPGVTNATFSVQIINDTIAEDDETVTLQLSNPTGGATIGAQTATLTIIDNDTPNGRLNFSSAAYATNENAGAAIVTVNRSGASTGTLKVYYATSNGTAISGTDYVGVTNSLTWNSGDITPKTFTIPLIDNSLVDGKRTINLRLAGASLNGVTNGASAIVIGSTSNAVLSILDDDSYGLVGFSQPTYQVNENGGPAIVTVTRVSGIAQSVSVNYATTGGTATPGVDYTNTSGVLVFAPGELSKSFTVPVIDNSTPNPGAPLSIGVALTSFSPGLAQGALTNSIINIVDDETVNTPAGSPDTSTDPTLGANGNIFALGLQTNGQVVVAGDFTQLDNITRNRIGRLNTNGTIDSTFSSPVGGVDAPIRAMVIQADGRVLIGGSFTNVNGSVNSRIARLNYNGSIDSLFNLGAGLDNDVNALAETFAIDGTRRLYIGGSFLNYNSTPVSRIARLNDDGSVDASFSSGTGPNGPIYTVLPYPTNSVRAGQVLIAGDFTSYNGTTRTRIARLFANGSIDTTFNPSTGADGAVRAILLQTDEKIVVGGLFTNFNGVVVNHITRLNADGSNDASFNVGTGTDDGVLAMVLQPDNKILVAGQFNVANGITRHGITRLNSDGSEDPTINFGLGADGFVAALALQPDAKFWIGGGFDAYDGQQYNHLVRIYGGALNGSGTFEFDSANYTVNENGTNAIVTIRRRGGTSGFPGGNVFVTMNTSDGTAQAGVNYTAVSTNVTFPPGEVIANIAIPIADDFLVNPDRTVNLALSNPQPSGDPSLGAPGLGNQTTALLTIINDDSSVSFSSATYSVNENTGLGAAVIEFVRAGSTNNAASVTFSTTTNGTAVAGVNFVPLTNTISFAAGQTNALILVPVLYDTTPEGNKTVTMELANAIGAILVQPASSVLTIIDVERAPGQFLFTTNSFYITENAGSGPITIIRTNGSSGVVSVQFSTIPGTAHAGVDYSATNGSLTFADGETVKSFDLGVIDDAIVEGPRSLMVQLTNASGGASLLQSNALVTVLDNEVGISFGSPAYSVLESGGSVTLAVQRLNSTAGSLSVQFATSNNTATAGSDYVAQNGTLTFANGESLKTITIPILDNSVVDGNRSFTVGLFNIQPPGSAQLVTASSTVTVIDDDMGFMFTNAVYTVIGSTTNLQVTVIRTNAQPTVTNTVNYFTTDGTAVAGRDYLTTSGQLIFTNGETAQTILVPVLQDTLLLQNVFFTLSLTNPVGAQLVGLTNTTIQIIENNSAFSFSSPTYLVNEGGVAAVITVNRTGVLTNTVSVDYSTSDGTAHAGVRYVTTSGTLTFTNGETAKTFLVPVIDDNVIEGDQTVLLSLSNPIGNASIINPANAVLTIQDNDGSLIQAAGSALVSESGPVNGVIDPGETVTMLFGLRNTLGSATGNLIATLLATNGVTSPDGPQSYGVLVPGGASASRQFTFTASGTNGQQITALLQLQDGVTNLGLAAFSYTLGFTTNRFTNSTLITIRDNTNALPYPSTINVSGLNGSVTKATVTLTNLTHSHANDVDILLTSPAGAKMMLLANNGTNAMSNVNLTLDDAAAAPVPVIGSIVTGTNRPNPNFPVAAFPDPAPAGPYTNVLRACSNSAPNGPWSLFIIDDTSLDSGTLGGWILSLTTASIIQPSANLVIAASAAPSPVVVTSNLTYTIGVTNYGPSTATGVTITNLLPAGLTFVSASGGGWVTNGSSVAFTNLGTLGIGASAAVTVTVTATATGAYTNTIYATANETDPNINDNSVSVISTVVTASADLGLAMSAAPDPLTLGGNVTFTMTVSNNGPATATSVLLTNTLPASAAFVSASTPAYSLVGNVLVFTNLADIGNGGQSVVTVTLKPTVAGNITNSAAVGSAVIDPLKANNTAAAKVSVQALLLGASRSGGNFVLSWPNGAGTYAVESTPSLLQPIAWTTVTNPAAVLSGGQWTLTVGTTNGSKFFRIRQTGP